MPEKPRPSMRAPTVLEQQGRVKPGMRAMTTGEKLAASGAGLYESDFDRAYMQQPLIAALMKSSTRLSEGWGEEPLDYLVQALDPSLAIGVLRPGTRLAESQRTMPQFAERLGKPLSRKAEPTGSRRTRINRMAKASEEAYKEIAQRFPNTTAELGWVGQHVGRESMGHTQPPVSGPIAEEFIKAARQYNRDLAPDQPQAKLGAKVTMSPTNQENYNFIYRLLNGEYDKARSIKRTALEDLLHELTHSGAWVARRMSRASGATMDAPEWVDLAGKGGEVLGRLQYLLSPSEVGARVTAKRQAERLSAKPGQRTPTTRSYLDAVVEEYNRVLKREKAAELSTADRDLLADYMLKLAPELQYLFDPQGELGARLTYTPETTQLVRWGSQARKTPLMRRGVKTP